jgi:hypothetical protein
MTTFQDQPPQSRRALRQEQRDERSRAEEIDDSAEAQRSAPSGRRARAAAPDGLVEVPTAEGATPAEQAEPTVAEPVTAETATVEPSHVEAAEPVADDTDGAETPADAAETPVVSDSAIPKSFPFAEQVEATSDDAGHPGFRLRDFSPELSTSRAESQSARDWAQTDDESVPLDYQTQGGPAFGYVSPYSEPAPEAPAAEPSFDSLFADLVLPDEEAADTSHADTTDANPTGDVPEPTDEQTPNEQHAASDSSSPEASAPASAEVPVGEPIVVAEPAAPMTPVVVPPEERTLSRREWRAMRAAAEAAEAAAAAGETPEPEQQQPEQQEQPQQQEQTDQAASESAPDESPLDVLFHEPEAQQSEAQQPEAEQSEAQQPDSIPPLVEPATAPHSALSDAMAEFEALTRGANDTTPAAPATPFFAAPAPVVEPTPIDDAPAPAEEPAAAQAEPEQQAAAEAQPPAEQPRSPFSFLIDPNAAVTPVVTTDTGSYTPPVGHWSRQAELDDEHQMENTLSRDVGGGNVSAATNALVLPMIPQRDDFSSVLNATGEIMVTGTINLPGSVAATGRDSRHYDDPEVDHLFDAFDNEIANTDSAPVRAITAVSSHTATRGGIESGRKQSNRMLNVLLVTASVMAVAVAGLLIAGFVFNIF